MFDFVCTQYRKCDMSYLESLRVITGCIYKMILKDPSHPAGCSLYPPKSILVLVDTAVFESELLATEGED